MVPFPKGVTIDAVAAECWTLAYGADSFGDDTLQAGEWGVCFGNRWVRSEWLCAELPLIFRWSGARFETLIYLEYHHCAVWVPKDCIKFKNPIRIGYRRRHHNVVTKRKAGRDAEGNNIWEVVAPPPQSTKSCNELCHISFYQTIMKSAAIGACLTECEKYNAF